MLVSPHWRAVAGVDVGDSNSGFLSHCPHSQSLGEMQVGSDSPGERNTDIILLERTLWLHLCCDKNTFSLTSHMSALCVAELLALMVSPSPSLSPSRSLSPGMAEPGCEGDGDGGWTASVQNSVRGPWSSQKWQRATKAFIWRKKKDYMRICNIYIYIYMTYLLQVFILLHYLCL